MKVHLIPTAIILIFITEHVRCQSSWWNDPDEERTSENSRTTTTTARPWSTWRRTRAPIRDSWTSRRRDSNEETSRYPWRKITTTSTSKPEVQSSWTWGLDDSTETSDIPSKTTTNPPSNFWSSEDSGEESTKAPMMWSLDSPEEETTTPRRYFASRRTSAWEETTVRPRERNFRPLFKETNFKETTTVRSQFGGSSWSNSESEETTTFNSPNPWSSDESLEETTTKAARRKQNGRKFLRKTTTAPPDPSIFLVNDNYEPRTYQDNAWLNAPAAPPATTTTTTTTRRPMGAREPIIVASNDQMTLSKSPDQDSRITIACLCSHPTEDTRSVVSLVENQIEKLSPTEKVQAFEELINATKITNLEADTQIFTIAFLLKNSGDESLVIPHLKHLFPTPVQDVVWGKQLELIWKDQEKQTEFKLFVDGHYTLRSLPMSVLKTVPVTGEQWKFIPVYDLSSVVIYNIKRGTALKAEYNSPWQVVTLKPDMAQVVTEWIGDKDLAVYSRKAEYRWKLRLNCTSGLSVGGFKGAGGNAAGIPDESSCLVVVYSDLFANLALNLNSVEGVELLPDPGLFHIR